MLAFSATAQTSPVAAKPYSIVNMTQTMGTGGTDYVYADNDGRRLYVPRGGIILVYDLDTLKAQIRVVKRRLWEEHIAAWKRADELAGAGGNKGVLMKGGQWQTTPARAVP